MEKRSSSGKNINNKTGLTTLARSLTGTLLMWTFLFMISCRAFYHTAETPPDDILGNVRNVIGGMVTLAPGGQPVEGALIRLQIDYDDRDEPGVYTKSVTRGVMTNSNGEYILELYVPMVYGLTIRVTANVVKNPDGVCFDASQYQKTSEGLFVSHSEEVHIDIIPWFDRINFEGYECSPPEVIITSPADGAVFRVEDEITFASQVSDEHDQTGLAYRWTSSIDGDMNDEPSFMQTMSAGRHTVILYVEVTRNNPVRQETGIASIDIVIEPSGRSVADNRGDVLRLHGGGGLTAKGGNGGYHYGDDGTRNPLKPGFLLGAVIPFPQSPKLAIETGLQVETKGFKETFSYADDFTGEPGQFKAGEYGVMNIIFTSDTPTFLSSAADFKNSTSLTYLGIPVMVHGTPFSKQPQLGLLAGLQPSFLLSRTSKSSGFGNSTTTKGTDGFKNLDMGLLLGANYQLSSGLGIRLLYENGLVDITENEFDTFKNRAVKLTVTYDIPVNLHFFNRE